MFDFLQSHLILVVVLLSLALLFWLLHNSAKNLWTKEKAEFVAVETRMLADLNRAKDRLDTLEHELAAYRFGSAAKAAPRETPAASPVLMNGEAMPIPPDASKVS